MSWLKTVPVKTSMLHRLHHRMQAVSNVIIADQWKAPDQWPVAREALQRQGAADVPDKLPEKYPTVVPTIAHPLFTVAGNELLDLPRLKLMKAVRREGLHVFGLKVFGDDKIIDGDTAQRLIDVGFASFDRADYHIPLMGEMGELHLTLENAESEGRHAVVGVALDALHAYASPRVVQGAYGSLFDGDEDILKEVPGYIQAGVERRIMREIIAGAANYTADEYGRLLEWDVISQSGHDLFVKRMAPPPQFHR